MKDFFSQIIKPYAVKYWRYAAAVLTVVSVLVFTFWYGGNSSGLHGWKIGVRGTEAGRSVSTEIKGRADDILSSAGAGINYEAVKSSEVHESYTDPEGINGNKAYNTSDSAKEKPDSELANPDSKPSSGSSGISSGTDRNQNTDGTDNQSVNNASNNIAGTDGNAGANGIAGTGGNTVNGSTGTGSNTGANGGASSENNSEITEKTCTLSVSCATILNNMDMLDKSKKDIIPADGWILSDVNAVFSEGETVFDVLNRTLRDRGIHLEYSYTPLYGSYYIEGINNIYEFDCGELSGWMYSVNGVFIKYGCSSYVLKDGDVVKFVYTCDLGYDVGGGYVAGE